MKEKLEVLSFLREHELNGVICMCGWISGSRANSDG